MSTHRMDAYGQIVGFFNHAQVGTINGGNFIYNNWPDDPNKYLDLLYKRVAVNAILNGGGREDPVRCFPGTREEVQARIHRWRTEGFRSDRRPFWLSGPAGAGKSAIVQTVAEYCLAHDIPMANFFFFRSDGTRNRSEPVAATVAYQLLEVDPSLKDLVHSIIRNDPPIIHKSIQAQFSALVDIPVRQSASLMQSERPIVLLIDGLDECEPKEDQAALLEVLYNLVTSPNSPFIALVASRTEHQIMRSFNRLGSFCNSVFLDDTFRPDDDIRRYLEAHFVDIKRTHPLRQFLPPEWPSDDTIIHLVKKSSGQFIYAATVARFVSASPASPKESLAQVISLTSMGNNIPFARLDALYMYILSQAHYLNSVLEILAADAILKSCGVFPARRREILDQLGYPYEVFIFCLSDLSALVKLGDILVFYHASFSDFLVDEGRSKCYHPDFSTMASRIILLCVQQFDPPVLADGHIKMLTEWVKKRNVYLDDALANLHPRDHYYEFTGASGKATIFLDHLNVLYQAAEPVFYQFVFERWAVIWITLGEDIGQHGKKLSRWTGLDLKVQGWLRKRGHDSWDREWHALRALDRRYEHLRRQHSVK